MIVIHSSQICGLLFADSSQYVLNPRDLFVIVLFGIAFLVNFVFSIVLNFIVMGDASVCRICVLASHLICSLFALIYLYVSYKNEIIFIILVTVFILSIVFLFIMYLPGILDTIGIVKFDNGIMKKIFDWTLREISSFLLLGFALISSIISIIMIFDCKLTFSIFLLFLIVFHVGNPFNTFFLSVIHSKTSESKFHSMFAMMTNFLYIVSIISLIVAIIRNIPLNDSFVSSIDVVGNEMLTSSDEN